MPRWDDIHSDAPYTGVYILRGCKRSRGLGVAGTGAHRAGPRKVHTDDAFDDGERSHGLDASPQEPREFELPELQRELLPVLVVEPVEGISELGRWIVEGSAREHVDGEELIRVVDLDAPSHDIATVVDVDAHAGPVHHPPSLALGGPRPPHTT